MLNSITGILLPIALFTMMLGLGSSVGISDFVTAWRRPYALLLGLLSGVIIVPSLAFLALRSLHLQPDLAFGLLLVASCPGGLFSNYLTALARGQIALSISLTAAGSIAYVFTLPVWVQLGSQAFTQGSSDIVVPFARICLPLVSFLLVPVAIGMLLRSKAPKLLERYGDRVRDVGALTAIACYFAIVYEQRETMLETVAAALPIVVIFNLAALLFIIAAATMCRLTRTERITLAIEHMIRQEGTAIFVSVVLLERASATLPLLVNTLVGLCCALLVVAVSRRMNSERS